MWDLAIAAQEWGPLHAPGARLDHPDDLDGVRRTALLAHAYGVTRSRAEEVVDVIDEERRHHLDHIRNEAAAGNEPWATFWRDTDSERRAAADGVWLCEQRSALIAAIAAL